MKFVTYQLMDIDDFVETLRIIQNGMSASSFIEFLSKFLTLPTTS